MNKFWIYCALAICLALVVTPSAFATESPPAQDGIMDIVFEWIEAAIEVLLPEEANVEASADGKNDGTSAAMGGVLVPVG